MASSKAAEIDFAAYMEGIPPPPYQDQPPSYDDAGESSSAGAAEIVTSGGIRIPANLNAYYAGAFTKTFYIGEKKDAPSFAARIHSGLTKNPELVVYNGPSDKEDAIWATANQQSVWKAKNTIITIPALEGVPHDDERQTITMACNWNLKHATCNYTADVGSGKKTRREEFEWRSSHGKELKELGGYKWGWKLVRLSNDPFSTGGDRESRATGSTSDGQEVVAVWAHNNSLSMSKAFKFKFLGSALDGTLGERGAVLALISALRIWSIEVNASAAAAS
ncbi:hypothetical protein F4808DRAFT_418431 [Astrocystis sublimbata]|nr:hypothetical protein F4808DRAFT_418431 [Astrocystis sublimbata]